MALQPGQRIGPYEVVSAIGAGGMGEVYCALDTKLHRHVALKVLPDTFATDPERLARFQREAHVLAALKHPNIGAIYGLEEGALVLELVDGETLADRIARGPIAIEEALPIAKQIADALEAAHEQGITHRDLKPANIKVSREGAVKVLDFGLAKLTDTGAAPAGGGVSGLSLSPTITSPAQTALGVILGTAAYMAPEQAKGQPADRRSDMWAFGCLLYEMLTGARAFKGDDITDTLAEVLKSNVEWDKLPKETPPALHRLLRRCLNRDRKSRIGDAGAARLEIEEALLELQAPAAALALRPSSAWRWIAVGTTVIAVLAVVSAVVVVSRCSSGAPAAPIRFAVPPAQGARFQMTSGSPSQAVSPDGRSIVFVAAQPGKTPQLWLRSFDTLDARPLPGTEAAESAFAFWSPDSRSVAFFAQGRLKRLSLANGHVQTICDAKGGVGGTWSSDGTILIADLGGERLVRVPAAGGEPVQVPSDLSGSKAWPQFLPDGRRFLFFARGSQGSTIALGSLDEPATRKIRDTESKAIYSAGYVLFVRQSTLFAQPFDAARGEFAGDAFPVAEQIVVAQNGAAPFSASDAGVLSFRSSTADTSEIVSFARDGRRLRVLAPPGPYAQLSISPDGGQLSVQRNYGSSADIWLLDVNRALTTRLTSGRGEYGPVWSPDGKDVAYYQFGSTDRRAVRKSVGSSEERTFTTVPSSAILEDWSRDGRYVLYLHRGIQARAVEGEAKPFEVVPDRGGGLDEPKFSPDSRWIAYMSGDTGGYEIYIQRFPGPSERTRVSTSGGVQPKWRADMGELFFLTPAGTMMSVRLTKTGDAIAPSEPVPLFETSINVVGFADQYDVAPDGQRFAAIVPAPGTTTAPITIVVNWTSLPRE